MSTWNRLDLETSDYAQKCPWTLIWMGLKQCKIAIWQIFKTSFEKGVQKKDAIFLETRSIQEKLDWNQ